MTSELEFDLIEDDLDMELVPCKTVGCNYDPLPNQSKKEFGFFWREVGSSEEHCEICLHQIEVLGESDTSSVSKFVDAVYYVPPEFKHNDDTQLLVLTTEEKGILLHIYDVGSESLGIKPKEKPKISLPPVFICSAKWVKHKIDSDHKPMDGKRHCKICFYYSKLEFLFSQLAVLTNFTYTKVKYPNEERALQLIQEFINLLYRSDNIELFAEIWHGWSLPALDDLKCLFEPKTITKEIKEKYIPLNPWLNKGERLLYYHITFTGPPGISIESLQRNIQSNLFKWESGDFKYAIEHHKSGELHARLLVATHCQVKHDKVINGYSRKDGVRLESGVPKTRGLVTVDSVTNKGYFYQLLETFFHKEEHSTVFGHDFDFYDKTIFKLSKKTLPLPPT